MLRSRFSGLKSVLCLGAHADDIEIGCGGTIMKLLREHSNLNVTWVVFSARSRRKREAEQSARAFLNGNSRPTILVKDFKDSFFPSQSAAIKRFFERLKKDIQPDLVLTHFLEDRHQDHRLLAELTWNTFRNHLILEYEIPKYEGDLQQPNIYVPLSKEAAALKVALIVKHFPSQVGRSWFRAETFESLMRLRGIECNAPDGF